MFPAYQHMISRSNSDTIPKRHADYLAYYKASEQDCRIDKLTSINEFSLEYEQGFRSKYTLSWTTYLGWKVYMMHTGCFATITEYEPA